MTLKEIVKEIEELYLNENKHWCETIDNLRTKNEKLKKKLDIYRKYTGVYYDEETKKYYIAVDCDFGCKGDVITKEEFEVLNDE